MEGGVTLGDRFFGAVGDRFTTLGPNSLEALLDQRDALLMAARDALGGLWELRNWGSREQYEADPSVRALRAAIAKAERTD